MADGVVRAHQTTTMHRKVAGVARRMKTAATFFTGLAMALGADRLAYSQPSVAAAPVPAQTNVPTAKAPAGDRGLWDQIPGPEQMRSAYPTLAFRQGVGGKTKMTCKVVADGTMSDCAIVAEQPAGWGFGEATLSLARYFKVRPTTASGQSVAGAKITIPLTFAP